MTRDGLYLRNTVYINPSIYTKMSTETDEHVLYYCIFWMDSYANKQNAQDQRVCQFFHDFGVILDVDSPIEETSVMEIILLYYNRMLSISATCLYYPPTTQSELCCASASANIFPGYLIIQEVTRSYINVLQ